MHKASEILLTKDPTKLVFLGNAQRIGSTPGRAELNSIKAKLREPRLCESALSNQPWNSEHAKGFLMNWIKDERRGEASEGDELIREERVHKPLLTKRVLERAEMARRQLRKSPQPRNRRKKDGIGEENTEDIGEDKTRARRCKGRSWISSESRLREQ